MQNILCTNFIFIVSAKKKRPKGITSFIVCLSDHVSHFAFAGDHTLSTEYYIFFNIMYDSIKLLLATYAKRDGWSDNRQIDLLP